MASTPPHPPLPDPELIQTLRTALDPTYDIEREIGGGMSRVFVATERALNRRVVIKVLPPELTAGVNRERFRREIQFAARLQHPHIVPLLTAGQAGDILYYTMPLVEGETLRSRLERERHLSAPAVVAILQDVVDALAYAHGQGLVHRDIKPENILLQRHHALVTDFGVAKAIREALPGSAATTIGIAVGTPAYMAPEQLAADPSADHRIDLYAVGLLAYELLAGGSPFSGSSPQQTLARQMTERPTPPHLRSAEVPADLSALIMRCLEKDPEARWPSAEELLQALGRIRLTSEIQVSEPMPPSRRRLFIGATLVLLLGAGLSLYAMLGANRRGTASPSDSLSGGARPQADSTVVAQGDVGADSIRPAGLTRADSEAIATAFARRILESRATPGAPPPGAAPAPSPPPPAPAPAGSAPRTITIPLFPGGTPDSVRVLLERGVADSMLRVLSQLRRNVPGLPAGPGGAGGAGGVRPQLLREFTPPEMPGPGAPDRIVVLDIVDVSRERNLGAIAATLTDSLVSTLRHVGNTQILSGRRISQLERQLGNDQVLGTSLGANGILRGSLAARRDTLVLFVALFDTRQQRYVRSFRSMAPRAEAAQLTGRLGTQVQEWLRRPSPPDSI